MFQKRKATTSMAWLALFLLATGTTNTLIMTADAVEFIVRQGESIQSALNEANPGDIVRVAAGIYQESASLRYGLRISKDNITLIGQGSGSVLLLRNEQQSTGIYAGPPGCESRDLQETCPSFIYNLVVSGFSIEGFPDVGFQTRWVKNFYVTDIRSINNLYIGIYITISDHGWVTHSFSTGALDAGLWICGCENVTAEYNEVIHAPTGFEITVSNNVYVRHNYIHDNTAGFGLYNPAASATPPKPVMANWIIENNLIENNNYPNPNNGDGYDASVPPGIGVLILGVSHHTIANNIIRGHDQAGLVMAGWCTAAALNTEIGDCKRDPLRFDSRADFNVVKNNQFINNGGNPDADLGFPGLDVAFVFTPDFNETGVHNCFLGNKKLRSGRWSPLVPYADYLSLPRGLDGLPVPTLPIRGCLG